jgi:predicted transcriptional regulator
MHANRRSRGTLEQEIVLLLVGAPGAMTPAGVRDALGGELAYTTVMTVLSRLAEKGVVVRQRIGRAYAYSAVRDEDEITARQMQRLLDTSEDRAAVLARFIGVLSPGDEAVLADLLMRAEPDQDGVS